MAGLGLCAGVSATDKLVRIISVGLKWHRGFINLCLLGEGKCDAYLRLETSVYANLAAEHADYTK